MTLCIGRPAICASCIALLQRPRRRGRRSRQRTLRAPITFSPAPLFAPPVASSTPSSRRRCNKGVVEAGVPPATPNSRRTRWLRLPRCSRRDTVQWRDLRRAGHHAPAAGCRPGGDPPSRSGQEPAHSPCRPVERFGVAALRTPCSDSTCTLVKAISAARIRRDQRRRSLTCARKGSTQQAGPIPADTAFVPDLLARYDAVFAMYHDQGLPVLKHAGFRPCRQRDAQPWIRTSVDHGTVFFRPCRHGRADAGSLVAAVRLALDLASAPAALTSGLRAQARTRAMSPAIAAGDARPAQASVAGRNGVSKVQPQLAGSDRIGDRDCRRQVMLSPAITARLIVFALPSSSATSSGPARRAPLPRRSRAWCRSARAGSSARRADPGRAPACGRGELMIGTHADPQRPRATRRFLQSRRARRALDANRTSRLKSSR